MASNEIFILKDFSHENLQHWVYYGFSCLLLVFGLFHGRTSVSLYKLNYGKKNQMKYIIEPSFIKSFTMSSI